MDSDTLCSKEEETLKVTLCLLGNTVYSPRQIKLQQSICSLISLRRDVFKYFIYVFVFTQPGLRAFVWHQYQVYIH